MLFLIISSGGPLHLLRRLHAQKTKTVLNGCLYRQNQRYLRRLFLFILHQNMLVVVELVESLCNIHDMTRHNGWFILFTRFSNHLRQRVQ